MRVVFLQPFDRTQPYQESMPPLGLGYLSSYAKQKCWFLETFFCRTAEEAMSKKPDMVGISSATENFLDAVKLALEIKALSDVKIILGGIHITSLPHTLPKCFDIGVVGEGEETFTELVKAHNENVPTFDELSAIKGICFHKDGKVIVNEPRGFFPTLDDIPYPDRSILGEKWLISPHKQTHMITSRGCPYKCLFCASSLHWGRFRTFSAKYVVEEIEYLLKKYNSEEIYFFDDLFVGHIPRFKEICRLLREKKIYENVKFRSYARVDLMSEELADLFAELNFRYIDFGFESNSEKILGYYNKTHATPQANQRALDLLHARGISAGANFLIGAPVDTLEDMKMSLDFCVKNKDRLDRLSVGPVLPLPGTPLWFDALKDGIVSEDMDWSRFHLDLDNLDIDKLPHICKNVSKNDLLAFHKEFNRLAREINLQGEVKRLTFEGWMKDAIIESLRSELLTIKGSRLFKTAWKTRDLFRKKD